MRTLFAALFVATLAAPAVAQDKQPKGEKIELTTFSGHYEKNDSGLMGDVSVLLIADADGFEKVFGTVPPMGLGKNPGPKIDSVKKATFDASAVAAVIRRGNALVIYSNPVAYLDGDTVTISYKAELGKQTTARFASTMVLGLPKGKVKKVVFVENGKELGTTK